MRSHAKNRTFFFIPSGRQYPEDPTRDEHSATKIRTLLAPVFKDKTQASEEVYRALAVMALKPRLLIEFLELQDCLGTDDPEQSGFGAKWKSCTLL